MVRWENFALLVLRKVGLCVAKLVYGLCRNTAKLSAEFGRPKNLVKISKVDGLVVWLMEVVSSFRLACNAQINVKLVDIFTWRSELCLF
jgi:hypothetical protein